MKNIVLFLLSIVQFAAVAQINDTTKNEVKIAYEVYADFHYSYDFDRPINRFRFSDSNPQFVNQFAFGYGYGQVNILYKKFLAKAAFHSGEIVNLMYRDEDVLLKFIRELSMTYKVNDHLEFESGIFPAIQGNRF